VGEWSIRVQNALAALPLSETTHDVLDIAGLSQPEWSLLVKCCLCEPPFALDDLCVWLPYTARTAVEARLKELQATLYVQPVASGEFIVTDKGASLIKGWSSRERLLLASVRPLHGGSLKYLAEALEGVVEAALAAPSPPEKPRLFGSRRLAPDARATAMVRIDQALTDLYYFHEDCRVAAWSAAELDGPAFEVLTLLRRGEPRDQDSLSSSLAASRGHDEAYIVRLTHRLAERGLLVRTGSEVELTVAGRDLCESVETVTEQYYMPSWTLLPPLHLQRLRELLQRFTQGLRKAA
jgi:DNA-binding MarR family transcriptional regulator